MSQTACTTNLCVNEPPRSTQEQLTLAKLLRGYRELVVDLGGNPAVLLDEVGIRTDVLENCEARIPVHAFGELLENTARSLGCSDFGLRLAERQPPEAMLQPLERLFRTAPTVRDVLECCARHVSAFNSGLISSVDHDAVEGMHLLDYKLADGFSLFPQLMEYVLLLTHDSFVWLSAGFVRSRIVWLSHLNISAPVDYARRFNAVVKFGQETDGILFKDADLSARTAGCNAELYASEAQIVAERFPERNDIDVRVRQAIFKILTQSDSCTRPHVAQLIGLTERTLNRRLSMKGTNFEAIRDDVRKSLAFRYLARPDLPLTEVAGRLGYSELAVLSRCCRRWFGSPPRQVRKQLLTGHGAKRFTPAQPRYSSQMYA